MWSANYMALCGHLAGTLCHHQLRQVIPICLMQPIDCVLLAWNGDCLPGVWQSLDKHYQASAKYMYMSTAWHLLDHCLSDSLCHLAKWLSSNWQASSKRVAHTGSIKHMAIAWQSWWCRQLNFTGIGHHWRITQWHWQQALNNKVVYCNIICYNILESLRHPKSSCFTEAPPPSRLD